MKNKTIFLLLQKKEKNLPTQCYEGHKKSEINRELRDKPGRSSGTDITAPTLGTPKKQGAHVCLMSESLFHYRKYKTSLSGE